MAHRNAKEAQHAPVVHGTRSTTRSTTSKPHPGPHITPGDGAQVTLSERRTVTHGRARRTRRPGRQATIQSARLRLVLYRSGAGLQGPQYGTGMGILEAPGRPFLPEPTL